MKSIPVLLTALVMVAMLFAGCAKSETPSLTPDQTTPETAPAPGLTTTEASTGTLRVLVTDAPKYEVTSVVVHFSEVWVHKAADAEKDDGDWIPLTITGGSFESGENNEPGWVDLAELRDDEAKLLLAQGNIDVGMYTQLRVIMYVSEEDESEDEWVTVTYIPDPEDMENDEPKTKTVEAKLPSGELKFVSPFEVTEDGETQLLLDFDLQKSVVFTGATQSEDIKVIVKPVVKLSVEHEGALGTISGKVTDDSENPVAEAEVVIEGTTLSATTDENGDYTIADVPVGTYTVTASAEGYETDSQDNIEVNNDETTTVDFTLKQ